MKTKFLIFVFLINTALSLKAQTNDQNMNRTERCKITYKELFGGEALDGKGNDPELMEILQKYIFGEVFYIGDLSDKNRELLTVTTLATMQTLPQLKAHTSAALNVGVTPLEIREAIYLCAPFIGFPKTLNAIGVANEVFRERNITLPLEKAGTVDEDDRFEEGSLIQKSIYGDNMKKSLEGIPDDYQNIAADLLTNVCFGDFYTRNGLSLQEKELVVLTILITEGLTPQIKAHLAGNIKIGNNPETLCATIIHLAPYIGFSKSLNALRMVKDLNDSQL